VNKITRERKYTLIFLLFFGILLSLSQTFVGAQPSLNVVLLSPIANEYKPVDEKIEYTFQITSGGQGVDDVKAVLKIDGDIIATKNSRSSGKIDFDIKRRSSEPFTISLQVSKPGYINTTYTVNIENYYSVSINPDQNDLNTYETLQISGIFQRNDMGWEGLKVKLYFNNQYHSEQTTSITGIVSYIIDPPAYGENQYYLEYTIKGEVFQTEHITFTFLKALRISLNPIDQKNFTDFTSPLIQLDSVVYSHNIPQEGVQLEYYINDQLYERTTSDHHGKGSIQYQMHPDETISWYVKATKTNYETVQSIKKEYQVVLPILSTETISPVDGENVVNHTIPVTLKTRVLIEGVPEPNALTRFYVNNKFISSAISNDLGIASISVIPGTENTAYTWYVTVESEQGLDCTSSISTFSTPLLDPDIFITDFRTQSERLSIGEPSYMGIQLKWANGSFVKNSRVILNSGQSNNTNNKGWVFFPISSNQITKENYEIIDVPDETYNRILHKADTSIIWDKVVINLDSNSNRINVGEKANLTINACYAYDNQPFTGEIQLNTEPILYKVGSKEITAINIDDLIYGIKDFESNKITLIWDTVSLNIQNPEKRLIQYKEYEPIVIAVYSFDGTEFQGTYSLSDYSTNDIGENEITIISIHDTKYGLTSYFSNTIHIKVDEIVFETECSSLTPGKMKLDIFAFYQSDGSPVSDLEIKLGEYNATCLSEGHYFISFSSFNLRVSKTMIVSSSQGIVLTKTHQSILYGNVFVILSVLVSGTGGAYQYYKTKREQKVFKLTLQKVEDLTYFNTQNLVFDNLGYKDVFLSKVIEEGLFIEAYAEEQYLSVGYLQNYFKVENLDNIKHNLEIKPIDEINEIDVTTFYEGEISFSKNYVKYFTEKDFSLKASREISELDYEFSVRYYSAPVRFKAKILGKNDDVGFYIIDNTPQLEVHKELTQEAKMLMSRKLFSNRHYIQIDENVFTVIPKKYRIKDIDICKKPYDIKINESFIEKGLHFYPIRIDENIRKNSPLIEEKIKIIQQINLTIELGEIKIHKKRFKEKIGCKKILRFEQEINSEIKIQDKTQIMGEYFLKPALDNPSAFSPLMAPGLFPPDNYNEIQKGVYINKITSTSSDNEIKDVPQIRSGKNAESRIDGSKNILSNKRSQEPKRKKPTLKHLSQKL